MKANALISPDSGDRTQESMQAFSALVYYFITWNNVKESVGERAELNISKEII